MPDDRLAALRGSLDVVAGLVLMVLGAMLVVWTERGVANYQTALRQHGGAVVDLGNGQAHRTDLQGRMVRLVGIPQVAKAPMDADFGQQADTPLLTRHVEMFQWHELRMGGSVNYELDWLDQPQDSRRFRQPAGHLNPDKFPLSGARFTAARVTLDGYALGAALVRDLPGSVPVAPDMKTLPANFAATFSLRDGALVTSAQPGSPRLGDLRVSWSAVPLQQVTVLARVDGNDLVTVPNAADGKGYGVDAGDSPLLQMRPDLATQPTWIWPRRILAVLLAAIGAGLLRQHRAGHVAWVPALGGGLLMVGAFAAVPWLGHSTATLIVWIVVALIGVALLVWRRRAPMPRR